MGTVIIAKVRMGQELTMRKFVARSIKLCVPIRVCNDYGLFSTLVDERTGRPAVPSLPSEDPVNPLPEGKSLEVPASGPPVRWIEENGVSKNCSACRSIELYGSRRGKNHSKGCCDRYRRWVHEQVKEGPQGSTGSQMVHPHTEGEVLGERTPVALEQRASAEDEAPESVVDKGPMPLRTENASDVEVQLESDLSKREFLDEGPGGSVPSRPVKKLRTVFTKGCPACESGMSAPGIRHSAQCKRNQVVRVAVEAEQIVPELEVGGQDVSEPQVAHSTPVDEVSVRQGDASMDEVPVGGEFARVTSAKRSSETPLDQLEKEMGEERSRPRLASSLIDVFEHAFLATESDAPVRDLPLFSVQFASKATSVIVPFGKDKIRIWEPSSAVDDTTLKELAGESTLLGMKKEVQNLSDLETGDLYTHEQLQQKGLLETCRVIPTRWVTTDKGGGITRCRIVIKDVAKNSESARTLGISSPTPSSDALQTFLGLAGYNDLLVGSADVTAAFMATPLRTRNVVAKLPMSLTDQDGRSIYLHLKKALNGLRSASQEWTVFLTEIISVLGLSSDDIEPCLFSGRLKSGGMCLVMSYVDDILVAAESERDIELVLSLIGQKKVVLKKTGLIQSSKGGGGQLKFLGRQIFRQPGDKAVFVGLPNDYLKTTFESYGLKPGTGSRAAPDITGTLDQGGAELSPEAYSRFRAALGKLSWFAQTRQDIRAWVGLLATQQSKPTDATEKALKAVLRFLQNDQNIVLRTPADIPARDDGRPHPMLQGLERKNGVKLVCFSDASHAPLRSTGRRGVTGGVITAFGFLIKSLSRHQQLVSLSSMEAELYAMQAVAQEMVAVGKFLGRVLHTLGKSTEREVSGILFSDSESSLKLLRNMDIPRKSRHLEIKLEWIKEQVNRQRLEIRFLRGTDNPSDLLTKCLGTAVFDHHRVSLGFEVVEGQLASMTRLKHHNLVIVEVCCERGSSIANEARRMGIFYIGVTKDMETHRVFSGVKETLLQFRELKNVFVHVSSPCSLGSPLRHLRESGEPTDADFEWNEIFPYVGKYLKLGARSSFELPWRNEIWGRQLTLETLRCAGHNFDTPVHLCSTGLRSRSGRPVGKKLGFTSSSKPFVMTLNRLFGSCNCISEHASMSDVDWSETARYNEMLARGIVKAVITAFQN